MTKSLIYLWCEPDKFVKSKKIFKGVYKSIPFFDFFFLSKLLFQKKGLSKLNKYVYYFCC